MTENSDRPDHADEPEATTPEATAPEPARTDRDDAAPESVLTGFSWDDPSGAAPTRPEQPAGSDQPAPDAPAADAPAYGTAQASDTPPSSDEPSYGTPYGATPEAPAQYPPAAPYPPAGAQQDPYGQGAYGPTGQAGQPGQGGEGYAAAGQAYGQPYGQQPAPYAGGYGQSAPYTSTPQPYAYGPPPLSPEAEKVRSSAILWTVLNGISIFVCFNVFAIGGVICAAIGIGKARDDVQGARNLVKWSWILFAIGFALGLLLLIGYIVFVIGVIGTAGMNSGF
ncbi:hypothetical protein [Jannaschia sp. R86511]|uniref:hypothetical protein n=1 Tax=Jannaschia sp. R86511 TaxID=3093853 RepID=UPI0036D24D42